MSKKEITSRVVEQTYDNQAKDFATLAPGLLWWETVGKPAYDRNLENFYHRDDVKVLDLGTASARVPQYLITNGIPAKNITGVELSLEQVKIARQRVPEATFIHGDITNVKLPVKYFDLVTSNMVFEFLDEQALDQALTNAYASLKPEGAIFFITTHPEKMRRDSGLDDPGSFEATFPWGGQGPNYYRTLDNFTSAVEKAGFKINNLEELAIPPDAKALNPKEYERYSAYPYIRLVVKAHKTV